jgi:hypothetical protein
VLAVDFYIMSDLGIYSVNPTSRELSFSVFSQPTLVRGITQLIQQVVVDLVSDFDPVTGRGSNLLNRLGQITSDDRAQASKIASESINRSQRNVLRQQESFSSLSSTEKLESLRLISIAPGDFNTWIIEVELTPLRGQSVRFEVPNG